MKILLINHYAGSIYHGMEFRPYYLSKEWVKMGHDVTIVAASFSHLRQQNIEMGGKSIKEEYIDGIRYVWLKTLEYQGNGAGRIKNMLSFLRKLYQYLPAITKNFKPDAVIASSTYPLDSYPANWIAKKSGAKFVFELHDLWPMSPMVLGHMSKWHPFIMIMQRAEDYWCRNADLVVSLLPDAYKHLVERGMSMNKYIVIPNGVNLQDWETTDLLPELHQKVINKARSENRFILAFFGSHTASYNLVELLHAGMEIDQKRFLFIFVGDGIFKQKLIAIAKGLHPNSIAFLPPISKHCIPSLISASDASYVGAIDSPLTRYGIAMNKMFDAMMGGKPILFAANVSNNYIQKYDCGICVPGGNVEALAKGINDMLDTTSERRTEMGRNGVTAMLTHFTYPVLAQKFMDNLEGLVR